MKKKVSILLLLIVLVGALIACVACKDVNVTIVFIVDGETYSTIDTSGNEIVVIPQSPTKDGYTFDGWYWDNGTWQRPFTANSLLNEPLTADMSVYAKFTEIHTHSLTLQPANEATCVQQGNDAYYTCTCGKLFADEQGNQELTAIPTTEIIEHTPSEWITDSQPTCTANGSKHTECSVCHTTLQTETINANGHTPETAWKIDSNATCTENGSKHLECSACHVNLQTETIPASGHTPETEWIIDSNATCTINGSKHLECSVCHTTLQTETISKIGHVFNQQKVDNQYLCNEASCTNPSTYYYSCSCGARGEETFYFGSASPHLYYTAYMDMSRHILKCQTCNKFYEDAPHVFNDEYICRCGYELDFSQYLDFTVDKGQATVVGFNTIYQNIHPYPKELKIPLEYNGFPVVKIAPEAFVNCTMLTKVILTDNIQVIGASSFRNCNSLLNITIGNSVTAIGSMAFSDCSSLTSVTIGKSVTSIGNSAFSDCSSLTSIVIPDSVTTIDNYAFHLCRGLTSVTIGKSVTTIGASAFHGCSSLESITLPFVGGSIKTSTSTYQYPFGYIFGQDSYTGGVAIQQYYYGSSTSSRTSTTYYIPSSLKSVTITGGNILYGAFYNCSSLTSIVIPDSVTSIGSFAFYNCSSLPSVTIGKSVTTIGDGAFYDCRSLTSVVVDKENPVYYSEGNCLIEKGTKTLILGLSNSVITSDITIIASGAFSGCINLTSITIPDSVTEIGNYAFRNCSSLTSIVIPNSVTTIGLSAFYRCSSLTSIVIPNSISTIVSDAFSGCSSLTSVTIPDSVTEIGNYAFYNCSSLTSVTIGKSVTTIGNYAFYDCSSLRIVYYQGTADEWAKIRINNFNTKLADATRYYYSEIEPELNADGTAYDGNYWYYNDNHKIVVWTKES